MIPIPVLPGPAPRFLNELPARHLLRDLVQEHAQLLAFLDQLDDLIEEYRDEAGTPRAAAVAATIRRLAGNLIGAEPHHQREEELLFPEIERRGVAVPPRVMRREHDELRSWKHKLLAAASKPAPDTEEIAEAAGSLAGLLRDHIHKENEVLYPMALALIREADSWNRLLAAAEKIGPCHWQEIAPS